MIRRLLLSALGLALLAAIGAQAVLHNDQARLQGLPRAARGEWRPTLAALPRLPATQAELARAATTPEAAVAAWQAAHRAQPLAADPLFALAAALPPSGDRATADALVAAAVQRAPALARTHLQAAAYWESRGQPAAVVQALAQALALAPARHATLWPVLLTLVADSAAVPVLASYAQEPLPWWPAFFRHVAQHGDRATLQTLVAWRRAAGAAPLTAVERTAYVARLLRDGESARAYLQWVSGLPAAERAHLGLLFNGDFELPLGHPPFGWETTPTPTWTPRVAPTPGAHGTAALELRFRHFTPRFAHLRQRLLAPPGHYQLRGAVRLDGLTSLAGLHWRLDCPPSAPGAPWRHLARSESFQGTAPWHTFVVPVTVPADCPVQVLKLVAGGKSPVEYRLDGRLWFDHLRLQPAVKTVADPAAIPLDENAVSPDNRPGIL